MLDYILFTALPWLVIGACGLAIVQRVIESAGGDAPVSTRLSQEHPRPSVPIAIVREPRADITGAQHRDRSRS